MMRSHVLLLLQTVFVNFIVKSEVAGMNCTEGRISEKASQDGESAYVGCFNISCYTDAGGNYTNQVLFDLMMTIERCTNYCRSLSSSHAGLTGMRFCMCIELNCSTGDQDNRVCDNYCGYPCPGYSYGYPTCGGVDSVQVYSVNQSTVSSKNSWENGVSPTITVQNSGTRTTLRTNNTSRTMLSTREYNFTSVKVSPGKSKQVGELWDNKATVSMGIFIFVSYVAFVYLYCRMRRRRRRRECGNIHAVTFHPPENVQTYINQPHERQKATVKTFRLPKRKFSCKRKSSQDAAASEKAPQQPDAGRQVLPSGNGHVMYAQARRRSSRLRSLKMKHIYFRRGRSRRGKRDTMEVESKKTIQTDAGRCGRSRWQGDDDVERVHEADDAWCPIHASYQIGSRDLSSSRYLHDLLQAAGSGVGATSEETCRSSSDVVIYDNFPPPRPRAYTEAASKHPNHSHESPDFQRRTVLDSRYRRRHHPIVPDSVSFRDPTNSMFTAAYHLGTIMKSCGELRDLMFQDASQDSQQEFITGKNRWSPRHPRGAMTLPDAGHLTVVTNATPAYANNHYPFRPGISCGEIRELETQESQMASRHFTSRNRGFSGSCDMI